MNNYCESDMLSARSNGGVNMLIVRDLPGFKALEHTIMMLPGRSLGMPSDDNISDELWEKLDTLSKETFGIDMEATYFPLDEEDIDLFLTADERDVQMRKLEKHEESYSVSNLPTGEGILEMLDLGIDFRDDYGLPMKSVDFFIRQAEAAVKGLIGHLPNGQRPEDAKWAASLSNEAEVFQRRKLARAGGC